MLLKQCTGDAVFTQLVKIEQNLTVSHVLAKCPIIATQSEKKHIIPEIIRIIEFFLKATGKELETYQIQILAGDLYEKFKTDTLEDVVLMFKMARQSEFGKIYRCDTLEIMEWCNKYLDYKSATREKLVYKKKKKVEEISQNAKSFADLSKELQDKFNSIGKNKTGYSITADAKELLNREKIRNDLQKKFDKKNDTSHTQRK